MDASLMFVTLLIKNNYVVWLSLANIRMYVLANRNTKSFFSMYVHMYVHTLFIKKANT